LYLNLIWSLLITIAVFFLIGRTLELSTRLYGLPVLASLLPKASATEPIDLTHHFVVFVSTLVIVDILIIGCALCVLFFYLKLRWSKSGSGCMYYKCPSQNKFAPQEDDFETYRKYRAPAPPSTPFTNIPMTNVPLHTLPKGLQSRLYPDPTSASPLCLQP